MIISTPERSDTSLEVMGLDDTNNMEIDRKFDCRCRIRRRSAKNDGIPIQLEI